MTFQKKIGVFGGLLTKYYIHVGSLTGDDYVGLKFTNFA